MVGWKKLVLRAAGFGGGFAVVMAAVVGGFVWYQDRPKQWNAKAIVATFDYLGTEAGKPTGPNGVKPDPTIVLYYTLENTTDTDYHMPNQGELEIEARLNQENSLTGGVDFITFDKRQAFIPAKQRTQFTVHLQLPYRATENEPSDATIKEEPRKKLKLIADYMNKEVPNLNGFVVFDSISRYQINLPNGWSKIALK